MTTGGHDFKPGRPAADKIAKLAFSKLFTGLKSCEAEVQAGVKMPISHTINTHTAI